MRSTLLILSLLILSTACQVPLSPNTGRTVTVQLPNSSSRGGGPADTALTAFPPAILGTLDHFVVKITNGSSSLVADQSVPASTAAVTFTGVPAGNRFIVVEAWTSTVLTAVGTVAITITDDTLSTVGPAVLSPVAGTGPGDFDLTLLVGDPVESLLAEDVVTARISPFLTNTDGSVAAAGPPLTTGTVTISHPGANQLRLLATGLPAGNYLLELRTSGFEWPTLSVSTFATLVVQVYAGQTSSLPTNTLLGVSPSLVTVPAPSGLRLDVADDGTRVLSWEAPFQTLLPSFQIGYSLDDQATAPSTYLSLGGGLDGNHLVYTDPILVGDRYQVSLDLTQPPWTPADPAFRVFVRALQGPLAASPWASLTADATSNASDLALTHWVFSGLAPGAAYTLQRKTIADNHVVEQRPFVTGTTETMALEMPGFVLHQGESLQLVPRDGGMPLMPIETSLLPKVTPGLFPPSTVFHAYLGYASTDTNRVSPALYLLTDELKAPAGLSATVSNLTWDNTNGGQQWSRALGTDPALLSVESTLNPAPEGLWEKSWAELTSILGYPSKWGPAPNATTGYRLRIGYSLDRNLDTVADLVLFGPATPWAEVDRLPPQVAVTLTGSSTYSIPALDDIHLRIQYSGSMGSFKVQLVNGLGTPALSDAAFFDLAASTPGQGQIDWQTQWSAVTAGQRVPWLNLSTDRYLLKITVVDPQGNPGVATVPINLVGVPK